MKNVIKSITQSGTNQWKGKTLVKWFVMFEDNSNGTLTTGFDETEPPKVGDEIEYETEDKGFGVEIKLPRKGGFGGGGFKAKSWSPAQVAQQDAVKLTQSYIQSGGDLKFWKAFFVECKEFMIAQIEEKPTQPETLIDTTDPAKDKLPF